MNPSVFGKALETAAQIKDPNSVAAFAVVIACGGFWIASRTRDRRTRAVSVLLGAGIILLGALPLLAHTYGSTHGVYEVRVVVLKPDGTPAEDSVVVCSPGGEQKSIAGGWECDLAPHSRPASGVFKAYASRKASSESGEGELILQNDYNPVLTVQLKADRSSSIRGEVTGKGGRALAGAWVSVVGYASERVQTDAGGGFVLSTHAADGQMIQVHAEAKKYSPYEALQQSGDTNVSIQMAP